MVGSNATPEAKADVQRAGMRVMKKRDLGVPDDFPLFPHQTGRWAKKINGRFVYFGKVMDDLHGENALRNYHKYKLIPRHENDERLADSDERLADSIASLIADRLAKKLWPVATIAESLFNEEEAARRLGIEPALLRRIRKGGSLKYYRIGKAVRYDSQCIDDYLRTTVRECSQVKEIDVKITKYGDRRFYVMYFDDPQIGKRCTRSTRLEAKENAEDLAACWSEVLAGRCDQSQLDTKWSGLIRMERRQRRSALMILGTGQLQNQLKEFEDGKRDDHN